MEGVTGRGTWARWLGERGLAGASRVGSLPIITSQAETSKAVGGLSLRLNKCFPLVRETEGSGTAASCCRPTPTDMGRARVPQGQVSSRGLLYHAHTHSYSSAQMHTHSSEGTVGGGPEVTT